MVAPVSVRAFRSQKIYDPEDRARQIGRKRILMPLVRVTMIKGKSPDYIKKMSDSIYEALVEASNAGERTVPDHRAT